LEDFMDTVSAQEQIVATIAERLEKRKQEQAASEQLKKEAAAARDAQRRLDALAVVKSKLGDFFPLVGADFRTWESACSTGDWGISVRFTCGVLETEIFRLCNGGRWDNSSLENLRDWVIAQFEKSYTALQEKYAAAVRAAEENSKRDAEVAEQRTKEAESKARAEAKVAEAIEKTRSELFQWPTGRALVLQKWEWMTGAYPAGEQSEGGVERDSGWSRERHSSPGFVEFIADARHPKSRSIIIGTWVLPTIEDVYFASTESLPRELTEEVQAHVDGVTRDYGSGYKEAAGAGISEVVGRQPIKSIRDLLTQPKETAS
jgi:hypothetical protein